MGMPPSQNPLQNLYRKLSVVWKFHSDVPLGCFRPGLGLHLHPHPGAHSPDSIHTPPTLVVKCTIAETVFFPSVGPSHPQHCVRHPLGLTGSCPPSKHKSGQLQMELPAAVHQGACLSTPPSLDQNSVSQGSWMSVASGSLHALVQIPGLMPEPQNQNPSINTELK